MHFLDLLYSEGKNGKGTAFSRAVMCRKGFRLQPL